MASEGDSAFTAVLMISWQEVAQDAECFPVCIETFTRWRERSLLRARRASSRADVNDWVLVAGFCTKWLNQARYYNGLTIGARKARELKLTTWLRMSLGRSTWFSDMLETQENPQNITVKRPRTVDQEAETETLSKRLRHNSVTIRASA